MNKNELKETFLKVINEQVPQDVHAIAERVSERFRQTLVNKSKQRILWELIMESKITRYIAVAAVLVIAAFVGAQIFNGSGNQRNVIADKQTTHTAIETSIQTPARNQLETELKNIEQMYAAGDVDGLIKTLANGTYESKIAAANFLAKIGDSRAVEPLSKLGQTWQGNEKENPFTAAVEAINERSNKSEGANFENAGSSKQFSTSTQPASQASQTNQGAKKNAGLGSKVDLKLRLKAGESHETKMTQTQDMAQTMAGQEIKVKQTQEMVMGLDCLSVDANGNMDIVMAYKSMKIAIDSPMGHMEIDSANPKPTDPNKPQEKMMAAMVSAMTGCKFQMKVKPTGETYDVRGIKEMLTTVKLKMSNGDQAQNMDKFIDKMFDEKQLKELIRNVMEAFPIEPVAVGDTWYDTKTINFMMPIDIDTTYMLKSRKDGIAYIDAVSKMDMGDSSKPLEIDPNSKMTMQISGTINASSEVDEKTGLTRKGNATMNFSGVMRMEANPQMPEGMTMPMTIKGDAVVELIK